MANFKIPNLCGASAELNAASSKIADLESKIASQIDAVASEAAAAVNTALADVKAGLDGLALDLPSLPSINFQSELTGLLSINLTTPQGLIQYTAKLAELEKDFGDTLTKAGKSLDSLITDGVAAISGGGDLCAIAPNLEKSAAGGEVLEKAQGVKTALKNAADEVKSTIVKNANVESIKTELKAKGDAVKSGTSFTATTKSTPIVTSTGRVIEASTTKDLVTKNAKGQKVRATKSAAGIAGKFKIIKDAWYNPTNLGAHPFDAVVYNNVDTLEKATAIFVSKKYKISDDLSNHKWSNYPPVEILTYFFMFWQPNYDKYSINELKEIQAQGTAAINAAADWDIDFIKTNADGSVQSGIAAARRKAGGVGSEGFDMDYFGKTEQMQAIKSFKGKPQIFAFYFKYKVLDTTDSNYE